MSVINGVTHKTIDGNEPVIQTELDLLCLLGELYAKAERLQKVNFMGINASTVDGQVCIQFEYRTDLQVLFRGVAFEIEENSIYEAVNSVGYYMDYRGVRFFALDKKEPDNNPEENDLNKYYPKE